ncbi:hypothetical protein [Halomarina rubra]|uniref:Uncharacterized protein n=1 Tax=Halomarina rubra TaxID=2071873 RepID=A0ABD6B0M8_9EURY|nr:hypothetical protein [Halomarina rubra]
MRSPSPSDLFVVSGLTAFAAVTGHLLLAVAAAFALRSDTRQWVERRLRRGEQL